MNSARPLRIALLHLEPKTGDLQYNCNLVETAARAAAVLEADWIVTPELCVSGYQFEAKLGTGWIEPYPDSWTSHFCRLAAELQITMFLAHQERDRQSSNLYNAVFVIGADGTVLGKHRKINVVKGCENWSTRGGDPTPIEIGSVAVGVLICADSYTPDAAKRLKAQGAQLLISSASWCPRPHGPDGCWENRSRETGLPLFVCNRTGMDQTLDFTESQSVVINDGTRLAEFQADYSAIVLVDWDRATNQLVRHKSIRLETAPIEAAALQNSE